MSNNDKYYGSSAFVDDADEDVEYTYNANGSMTKDLNKGITNIEYDNAGNLKKITFNGDRSISYVYAADGIRLRTVHSHKKGIVTINDSTEYLGNLVLRNGNPDQYMFNGGYYSFSNNTLDGCHYYIKDYLGSNRMVMSKTGQTEQVNHYYPYGGIIGGIDLHPSYQSYKYEGKELDNTFGLDWYDIHALQYDPIIPSWHAIDPMCEKYYNLSPYAFCGNNPISIKDVDGKDGIIVFNDNNIEILCNIYFYGKGATKDVVNQMQNDVNSIWGGIHRVRHNRNNYNVIVSIKMNLYRGKEMQDLLFILDTWNPFSRNNYIELKKEEFQSYTDDGDEGVWRSVGRKGLPLSMDDPAPHEVGHLLGLEDKYNTNDPKNPPLKGWGGNVMADGTKVDDRNIMEILQNAWEEYDKWRQKGNDGQFKYEINP